MPEVNREAGSTGSGGREESELAAGEWSVPPERGRPIQPYCQFREKKKRFALVCLFAIPAADYGENDMVMGNSAGTPIGTGVTSTWASCVSRSAWEHRRSLAPQGHHALVRFLRPHRGPIPLCLCVR